MTWTGHKKDHLVWTVCWKGFPLMQLRRAKKGPTLDVWQLTLKSPALLDQPWEKKPLKTKPSCVFSSAWLCSTDELTE